MRTRATPRSIPTTPNRFTLDLPGVGLTHWRLPFPVYLRPLLSAGAQKVDGESQDDAAIRMYEVGGAAIGRCWDSPTHDLDAPHSDDLRAYGRSVLEELADAGWGLDAVSAALPELFGRLSDAAFPRASEVASRAGFSEAPPAPGS